MFGRDVLLAMQLDTDGLVQLCVALDLHLLVWTYYYILPKTVKIIGKMASTPYLRWPASVPPAHRSVERGTSLRC